MLRMIDQAIGDHGRCRILDLGGTERYWRLMAPMLGDRPVEITLVNLTDHGHPPSPDAWPPVKLVIGDITTMAPGAIPAELIHSNSVIEHVIGWAQREQFARAVREGAESYYIQTPNYWFPYELHFRTWFYHWLSPSARAHLLTKKRRGFFKQSSSFGSAMEVVETIDLLDKRQMRALFPDSVITTEQLGPLAKSLMAVRYRNQADTKALLHSRL
ncbi:MAG: hypothetical protein EAZ99_06835 [Alphaproteobacteria bacterium]|nr:MAG: hypothetical protein EAZ99_06835 [Alphaproteobacteria bacterium]